MDRFFSVFEDKSQNQKILIGVGFSALVLVLMAISFLLTTPQTNNPKNSGNSDANQNPSSNSNPSSGNSFPSASSFPGTNQVNIPEGWETFRYSDYQISYPSSLTVQLGGISGGGVSISFIQKPSTIAVSQSNIEMQVYDAKDIPLQQIAGVFSAFGHTKSAITIGGINAQKFSGSIFATTSASLHTVAVIFEDNGRTFKIQLDYMAEGQNNQIESLFNKIVSTFSFISPQ